jgi:UDP-glucose 4-epimerase
MKTVLVTGAAGYIGTSTCKQLLAAGYRVIGVDRKKGKLAGVDHHQMDIASPIMPGLLAVLKPDVVIHFAADHEVGRSVTEPGVFYQNNVANTIHLLNQSVAAGVKQFVFSSSCAVYGNATSVVSEDSPIAPVSSYGRSKAIIESILQDYYLAYGIKYVSLRYFNAAGAEADVSHGYTQKPPSHLIPILSRSVLANKPIQIYGNNYPTADGTCVRDYTHVSDIASAHLAAISYLESNINGIFNIGTGTSHSVLDVTEAMKNLGYTVNIEIAAPRPGDAVELRADVSRANNILNWTSQYTLNDIIAHSMAWETKTKLYKELT